MNGSPVAGGNIACVNKTVTAHSSYSPLIPPSRFHKMFGTSWNQQKCRTLLRFIQSSAVAQVLSKGTFIYHPDGSGQPAHIQLQADQPGACPVAMPLGSSAVQQAIHLQPPLVL